VVVCSAVVSVLSVMGCNGSKPSASDEAEKSKSAAVNKAIADAQRADEQVNKLLLLGAGESGKSTLFKQMITIYGTGFPEPERITYRPIIYQNVMAAMNTMLQQCDERKLQLSSAGEAARDALSSAGERGDERLTPELAALLRTLWTDKAIQNAYAARATYQLADSTAYYLDKIAEMSVTDYIPTQQDVLRSRVRTTGIVENDFEIDGNKFKMYDVGGQRNERKKWIHCFENVTALIFVAAISEYDQVLYESEDTNRMREALTLFDQIVNSRWFAKTSVILFLNKRDLFQKKLESGVPMTAAFPEYTGPLEYAACVAHIEKAFFDLNRSKDKEIYCHVTTATDTGNIGHVFGAVKDIVIQASIKQAGLS